MDLWDKVIWDKRFMDLAEHVSSWSKDPSTKVGAVVVDPKTRVVRGLGYNGFPRGVTDSEERLNDRPTKYSLVVHAELNAILNAKDVEGCYLYVWPLFTCGECAKSIIQSGISRVIVIQPNEGTSWANSFDIATKMYAESGVTVDIIQ